MANNDFSSFVSPFSSRYASEQMKHIFSAEEKFRTWRRLWVALAQAERELGLAISQEQIDELEKNVDNINFSEAIENEKKLKHDVMAHIHAYSKQCPNAAKIIHLGATSCYVVDNADIILMKKGLDLIQEKLLGTIYFLSEFAQKTKNIPCLAFTHLQPAQLTTVGKRAVLWLNELCLDEQNLEHVKSNLKLLGCKGTTGTQASFLRLFDGDETKVDLLEQKIVEKMNFKNAVEVSGQTYSRKIDYFVCCVLSGIAQSATKFATDLRILQNFKELEEPFDNNQVGSSAMPYKKNPMKSERIVAIARYIMVNTLNPALTAANQWFERTLDDSANKRIAISEAFLATDSILNIMLNICQNIIVNEKIIQKNVETQLPFMATENILMEATKNGGDRQKIHEIIRQKSWEVAQNMKTDSNQKNNLVQLLAKEPEIGLNQAEIEAMVDPKNFTGLSSSQVDKFLKDVVEPMLKHNKIETRSSVEF